MLKYLFSSMVKVYSTKVQKTMRNPELLWLMYIWCTFDERETQFSKKKFYSMIFLYNSILAEGFGTLNCVKVNHFVNSER